MPCGRVPRIGSNKNNREQIDAAVSSSGECLAHFVSVFLTNMFNFFDRTIPAIIIEPIRMKWRLSDLQLGLIGTAFILVTGDGRFGVQLC